MYYFLLLGRARHSACGLTGLPIESGLALAAAATMSRYSPVSFCSRLRTADTDPSHFCVLGIFKSVLTLSDISFPKYDFLP